MAEGQIMKKRQIIPVKRYESDDFLIKSSKPRKIGAAFHGDGDEPSFRQQKYQKASWEVNKGFKDKNAKNPKNEVTQSFASPKSTSNWKYL